MSAIVTVFLIVTFIFLILFAAQLAGIKFEHKADRLGKFAYSIAEKKVDYNKLDRELRSKLKLSMSEEEIRTVYNSLKCRNCGGMINFNNIKQQSGFITLQCQYCRSIYYLNQGYREIKRDKLDND